MAIRCAGSWLLIQACTIKHAPLKFDYSRLKPTDSTPRIKLQGPAHSALTLATRIRSPTASRRQRRVERRLAVQQGVARFQVGVAGLGSPSYSPIGSGMPAYPFHPGKGKSGGKRKRKGKGKGKSGAVPWGDCQTRENGRGDMWAGLRPEQPARVPIACMRAA